MKPQKQFKILLIDALINLLLGILLLLFSDTIANMLGAPASKSAFYPNILGAVLIGIAIALIIEYYRKPSGLVGLGLGGAVSINLCGGLVLSLWLLFGSLNLPLKGLIFLWSLVFILVIISLAEIFFYHRRK